MSLNPNLLGTITIPQTRKSLCCLPAPSTDIEFSVSNSRFSKLEAKVDELVEKIKKAWVAILDFTAPRNPVTYRREVRILPVWFEKTMGVAYYDSVCPKSKISKDPVLNAKVEEVFSKLVKHCERKDLAYEVRVMEDNKTVNAFCLPGGKVVITTALLEKLEKEEVPTEKGFEAIKFEDKLAAVLGHEIVHAAAGHTARSLQFRMLITVVAKVTGIILSCLIYPSNPNVKDPVLVAETKKKRENFRQAFDLTSGIAGVLATMHNSRSHELESDRHGIKYMHMANYNVDAAIWLQKMFSKMKNEKELGNQSALDKGFEVISTHPCSERRVIANRFTIKVLREKGMDVAF